MIQGKRLVVNVDVSNTTFWHETAVSQLAYQITGAATYLDMINMIQPIKATAYMPAHESPYFAALRRLHKNEIKVRFRGAGEGKSTSDIPHSGVGLYILTFPSNTQEDFQNRSNHLHDSSQPDV